MAEIEEADMRKAIKTVLCVAALAAVTTTSVGAGEFDRAIKARKAQMSLVGFQMGVLGSMAKGKAPYDAKAAQAAADNMVALSHMNSSALWPKGSDNVANPGMTRAKPDAWTTWPKIKEAGDAWKAASTKMAAAAGGGLDSLKGAMGGLGKACGGCHKPFRAPKKK
jgi:cytochrome c556